MYTSLVPAGRCILGHGWMDLGYSVIISIIRRTGGYGDTPSRIVFDLIYGFFLVCTYFWKLLG